MTAFAFAVFAALFASTTHIPLAHAQNTTTSSFVPLASKRFNWTDLPYQADTDIGVRGPQFGYNLCNSTTEGPESLCQTATVNSLDDFCLWAPPNGPTTIGEEEGETVAWCTRAGRGTRVIPPGALLGVQFMRTPDYVQVVGFINQTFINLISDDYGGEMDPHGADLRGNPIGGLVYSNAWSNGDNNSFTQVIEWHNFMGSNMFCFKVCDPAGANAARYCEHIFDRIGCAYNAPNNAQTGQYTSCDGDDQDFPGVYTDAAGAVQTYTQPPESLGPIVSIPYTARVPASSNCVTFQSTALYVTATSSGSSSTLTGGSSTGPSPSSSGTSGGSTGSAVGVDVGVYSVLSVVVGVVFSVVFFA